MSIREAMIPRPVTLVGGPHEGDTPVVDLITTAVTNESTGAIYERRKDEIWMFDFVGFEETA